MRSLMIVSVLVALAPTAVFAQDYQNKQPLLVKNFSEPYAEKEFRKGRTVCMPTGPEKILCKVRHQHRPSALSARYANTSYTLIENDPSIKMWVKTLDLLR
jgi:hypothetical protein